jgi:hypothetical protein
MLTTVEFDDQFAFGTGEVRYVAADRMLTPELAVSQGAILQKAPKAFLGVRRVSSESSGESSGGRCLHRHPHPCPLPFKGEGVSV